MADWFVDLSAANNGDGTDGAQAAAPGGVGAWNVLTATELLSVSAGDKIWIRRTDGSGGSKKTLSFKDGTLNSRIEFNGWPVDADDEHYAAAQATTNTVAATWDSDPSAFVVINPFGAAATVKHRVYRRLYWDETAAAANEPFATTTNGSLEVRWNKCQARRATSDAPKCNLWPDTGRLELDDVHVIGQRPATGFGNNCALYTGGLTGSAVIRARFTFTAAGSESMYIGGEAYDSYVEVLEWNDAGTRFVRPGYTSANTTLGGFGSARAVFTTDDDVVGMLPAGGVMYINGSANSRSIVVRNLDFEHANSPAPDSTTYNLGTTAVRSLILENIRFPAGASTHIDADAESGNNNLIGKNIWIDTTKILKAVDPNSYCGKGQQIHLTQLNGTNAWFRYVNGVTAQSSNISRVGGHANGILVETIKAGSYWDDKGFSAGGLFYSEREGYEALVFPRFGLAFPVNQTITLYFATAFWDGRESKLNIWVEADVYRDASGYHRKIYDSRKLPGDGLIADGSTWNNIMGYNAWRIELPITIKQDDIVRVRFYVADTFRDGGGNQNVTIFDPAITLA